MGVLNLWISILAQHLTGVIVLKQLRYRCVPASYVENLSAFMWVNVGVKKKHLRIIAMLFTAYKDKQKHSLKAV